MFRARRLFASMVAVALQLLAVADVAAQPLPPRPWPGVTLTERVFVAPRPARLIVAQVALDTPGLRVIVTPPSGGRETVRETTLEFLARTGAHLAVNAHFFLPFPSGDAEAFVIGLAAADGRVYSTFETPEQAYAIVADAPALHFDARNRARVARRRRGRDAARVDGRGRVWNAVAGSAQILTSGRVTIPRYRDAAHPGAALVPGPEGRYDTGRSWYDVVTSRTIAGVSRSGRVLTLAVVAGRAGVEGLTPGEIAEVLRRDFAVWDAINLDGGGSTTMAWRDPATGAPALLNTPTDATGARRVASSLAIIAPAATPRR